MADHLIVDWRTPATGTRNQGYGIVWICDGEQGAWLCESKDDGEGPEPKERGNYEHWLANRVARSMSDPESPGLWESEAAARRALKAIRVQLALPRELPAWAKTALEAGWQPPKGWKP